MPPVKKPKTKPINAPTEVKAAKVISGQLQKKIKRQQNKQAVLKRGVVFIRHLPHGFFEDQLRNYFEQFGTVTRLRLARSKVTGGTKGYAFVEFEYPEVAEVAAETMDNYLMFNKVLKAAYIPPEKQIYNFFKSSVRQVKSKAGKAIYVSGKTAAINKRVKKFNDNSDETYQNRTSQKLKKIEKLNKKYAHLRIDFSKIVVGSKKVEKEEKIKDDLPTKSEKRKITPMEKPTKKSKNTPSLENENLNEDSENNEGDSEISDEDLSKSVDLEDLLGATLNEDSDDDDWFAKADSENSECGEETDEQLSETEDDGSGSEEELKPPQKLQAQKKVSMGEKQKKYNLEQRIKHKKHTGGVQKANKALSKKTKISKSKNAMQAALAKQLAQPLPLLKNKMKVSKKQKSSK